MSKEDKHKFKWKCIKPEKVGLNSDFFRQTEDILRNEFKHIDSVMVAKGNSIIFEKYYNGFDKETLHRTACIYKGFISSAVGVAIQKNQIKNLDEKIVDIFTHNIPEKMHRKMSNITLKHALTKSTGLSGYPNVLNGDINYNDDISMILDLDIINESGELFEYKPDPHILVYTVEYLTGISFKEYVENELLNPLGITNYKWDISFSTIENMELCTRDIAKLGYLYLKNGLWEGQQIIPSNYINESTTHKIKGGFPENDSYGFLWWNMKYKDKHVFYASGFGGQYMFGVPELDILVVITSQLDRPHLENKAVFRMILDYLLNEANTIGINSSDSIERQAEKLYRLKVNEDELLCELKEFYNREREENVDPIELQGLLEFFINNLGTHVYNKGLKDAELWTMKRLQDIQNDYFEMYK